MLQGSSPRLPFRRVRVARAPLQVAVYRDETLVSFKLRPWLVAPLALTLFTVASWYLVATVYLILRDDLISDRTSEREVIVETYEEQIASLQLEVERVTSRHQVSERAQEQRIEELLARQAELESRHARVAGLVGADTLPYPRPAPGEIRRLQHAAAPAAPSAPFGLGFAADLKQGKRNPLAALPGLQPVSARNRDSSLDLLEQSLELIEAQQGATLFMLNHDARQEADTIRTALATLGIELGRGDEAESGVGGPFQALGDEAMFDVQASSTESALANLDTVRSAALDLPLGEPIPGASAISSFGPRRDPFLGRRAMHAGIDFRSRSGTPVYSPGSGTVVRAGRNGGYGNMIEINHGKGITTRHAHLSRILVSVGDDVSRGSLIGQVGSTGRSTGPHLHYETRLNGKAMNPTRFLAAGRELAPLLR